MDNQHIVSNGIIPSCLCCKRQFLNASQLCTICSTCEFYHQSEIKKALLEARIDEHFVNWLGNYPEDKFDKEELLHSGIMNEFESNRIKHLQSQLKQEKEGGV